MAAGGQKMQPKRGSSCTESELWNNLVAPRQVASSGFSIGPRRVWGDVGVRGGRSSKWKSCNASNGPAGSSERPAGGRVNQTGLLDETQEERDAQLVCSTGNGRAFGFAVVRSAKEQRNGRRYQWRRRNRGEKRSFG
jgi:hypothetical protein